MKKVFILLALIQYVLLLPAQNEKRDIQTWTIVATYTIPGKASGLAWDGTYLYSGLYSAPGDDNKIYKIDPSDGSYTLQCSGPFDKAYGLTYDDGSGNLWTTDHPGAYDPGKAIEFDMNGNYVSEFELPATYFSGIAYDDGDYWATCYYNPDGEVYKLDASGNVLDQFASPGQQPWDICLEGSYLWIADYNDDSLYKIDQSGTLLESHASENIKPAGIVYDGTYLWYVDGGLNVDSKLYKIDLSGSGNPDINVPITEHDYGIVTVDSTSTWACLIQNNGSAALQVTYGNISGSQSEYIGWPEGSSFTVDANSTYTMYISYTPGDTGTLDAVATLETNDPVTPDVDLTLTGTAVNPGPYLYLPQDSMDFGSVRIGATTRWEMEVTNMGSEDLTISDITFDDSHFYREQRDTIPVTISPLETKIIGVWFHPDSEDPVTATMSVSSNDTTQNPKVVPLMGEGLDKGWPMGDVFWNYTITDLYDSSPKAIIKIGDVTGDGVGDVIIASEDDYIRCFNGNSDGTGDVIWETYIYAGSVYSQNSLTTIEDIDADGYEDVIVGTAWGDRSVIALSGYSGKQIWKHQTDEYGDGGWVYQVDARYDYDDDGIADVLAATGNDGNGTGPIRVYCLEGRTGNSIWERPLGGPVFSVIGIEDFTGDGQADVIAGASNSNESEGYVYGIDGSNGNQKWQFVAAGTSVWALAQLDDVDNSGTKDFMLGDFSGQYYIVDPASLLTLYTSGIGNYLILRFVVLDDVNNDGYRDVLVAHSGPKAIILDGTGGTFINTPINDKSWCVARTGDLSGDGINDILVGTLYSNNYAYMINGSHGNVMFDTNYGEAVDAIGSISDINSDGSMEMVVGGRNGKVTCYSGGEDASVGIINTPKPETGLLSHGVYPNPFSRETAIYVELEKKEHLTVNVTDQNGKLLKILADQEFQEGKHEFRFDASGLNLKNGIYFYNIITEQTKVSGKLVVVN
ncbi:MAG: choice-of-anchor D domain-containing protein [Chlorobi bacterium]|nr:choice-of-anchor D domain-containing protein [Chlorobiota bacterium]